MNTGTHRHTHEDVIRGQHIHARTNERVTINKRRPNDVKRNCRNWCTRRSTNATRYNNSPATAPTRTNGCSSYQCIDISAAIGVQNRKSTASLKLVADKSLRQLSSSLSYLFTFQQIIQQTYYDISGGRLPQKPSGSLVWPPIVYHTYTPV